MAEVETIAEPILSAAPLVDTEKQENVVFKDARRYYLYGDKILIT